MVRPDPEPVDAEALGSWPLPEPGSDKESRGRILVVGGGTESPGAVRLAGEAALAAGAGKLQLATAAAVAPAMALVVPESRVIALPTEDDGVLRTPAAKAIIGAASQVDVVVLGPGFSDLDGTVALTNRVVPELDCTVVIDALATAYITDNPDGLGHLEGRCVVTANPTEVSRMLDRDPDEVGAEPAGAAVQLAERTAAVVLCGGAQKVIAQPDGRCWLVDAGGPGLGASGSGDVQAGIVGGLLARGAEPAQAAVWGAWLHGTAGERLAALVGPVGFLARDLPSLVPTLVAEVTG